ncbi:hypothetical protein MGSAQ_002673, partial [marine sediment metagenome]
VARACIDEWNGVVCKEKAR